MFQRPSRTFRRGGGTDGGSPRDHGAVHRQVADDAATAAQSGLELDIIDMIERVGLPTPVRQHPLTLLSGELIHLDIAWPDIRLAIEPGHSWWHGGDLRQRADQARDRASSLVGWHVHRYDEDAARDPAATAQEIRALYHQRAADVRRRSP